MTHDIRKMITNWLPLTDRSFLESERDRINPGPHQCEIIELNSRIALFYKDGYFSIENKWHSNEGYDRKFFKKP
jgi:hypothetical protein